MISDPDIFQVEEKVIYEWFLDSPSSSPFPTDGLQLQKILSSNLINASNRMFLIHSSLSILVCLLLSFIELNDTLSSNCNVSISRASLICRYVVYVGTKFYALSLWNLDMVQEQLQDRTRDINKRKTRIVYLACYDSSNINPFVGRTVLLWFQLLHSAKRIFQDSARNHYWNSCTGSTSKALHYNAGGFIIGSSCCSCVWKYVWIDRLSEEALWISQVMHNSPFPNLVKYSIWSISYPPNFRCYSSIVFRYLFD